ncbi:hypothetical protein LCGC14_3096240 [marine sediment metagenome]|uniref:Uncharacterized protein n=1 Tax=marine sediment metagenome TaxID=412755 RepID=A0A0F8WXW6_9ZZZZ
MREVVFKKKWAYGNPSKVQTDNGDWMRWIRFVNMVVDDHLPHTIIYSDWEDDTLYGRSHVTLDHDGSPIEDRHWVNASTKKADEDLRNAKPEDWRIETHQELVPIAMRVIKAIEKVELKHIAMQDAITKAMGEG